MQDIVKGNNNQIRIYTIDLTKVDSLEAQSCMTSGTILGIIFFRNLSLTPATSILVDHDIYQ